MQDAAEKALVAGGSVPSAIVAIDVATGEGGRCRQLPGDGMNRALTGHYAPGSGFKVASTMALLEKGLVTPETVVDCPPTITVDGKSFRNFEGGEATGVTFARLRPVVQHGLHRLERHPGPGDLAASGKALGIGAGWTDRIGVTGTFEGSIPRPRPAPTWRHR